MILRNFKKCFLAGEAVAVDESMVKFKGRSSLKQQREATKYGYWLINE